MVQRRRHLICPSTSGNELFVIARNNGGLPISECYNFDTELVSHTIAKFKREKALDIDGLCTEHLQFCRPSISVNLGKLFNIMLLCSYSYTVILTCYVSLQS